MWKLCENSNSEKPLEIDETSSKSVVYVRKDFEEIPTYGEDGEWIGTHWRYMENAVPKSDWTTYKEVIENQTATTDLEMALCDLYEMVMGGVVND